jgi:hypothetical protein
MTGTDAAPAPATAPVTVPSPRRYPPEARSFLLTPHLQVGATRVVDVPAARGIDAHRSYLASTACGAEVASTLVTRDRERTHCQACYDAQPYQPGDLVLVLEREPYRQLAVVSAVHEAGPEYEGWLIDVKAPGQYVLPLLPSEVAPATADAVAEHAESWLDVLERAHPSVAAVLAALRPLEVPRG